MSKQQRDQRKKRKKEESRKESLAKARAMLPQTSSRDNAFVDGIMELMEHKRYEEAKDRLLPYVVKKPKLSGPLGLLVVVCQETGDLATMFWAADRLINTPPNETEDYVLYFNSCAECKLPFTTAHAAQIALPLSHKIGVADEFEQNLALLPQQLAEIREQAVLDSPELGQSLSDDELWELARLQEQATLYFRCGKYDWTVQMCDRIIRRFPKSPTPYALKAYAAMTFRGPAQADPVFQQALAVHPNSAFLLCYRIHQLAMLSRLNEIDEYLERLDRIPLAKTYKPLDIAFTKMQTLVWIKRYDASLELYRNAAEILGDLWDITENTRCAGIAHLAAVVLAKRGEPFLDVLREANACSNADEIVRENYADAIKPSLEQNGPWFFYPTAYIPERLNDMFDPLFDNLPSEKEIPERELNAWIRKQAKPICREALRRWPHLPTMLVEMIQNGSIVARNWAGMFIGVCDSREFIEAVREFINGTDGTVKLRREFQNALI